MEAGRWKSGKRRGQWSLKPQDLAVALKLAVMPPERQSYAVLAEKLHLSQYEAHAAVGRLVAARLAADHGGDIGVRPIEAALIEFVIHGASYAFPAVRGGLTIGFPTAYAVKPLKEKVLFANEAPPVWPDPEGAVRGLALLPLYPKLPHAARSDPKFYEVLALLDALRIGQARERRMATELMMARLKP